MAIGFGSAIAEDFDIEKAIGVDQGYYFKGLNFSN